MDLELTLDAPAVRAQLVEFLRDYHERSGGKGFVVGLSGGLDSSVVAHLCAEAVGKRAVLGLTLPADSSNPLDQKHAHLVADQLGLPTEEFSIQPFLDAMHKACRHKATRLSDANLRSRARMLVLYWHANSTGKLVAATGNKSEILVGYFTKHGDGAGDVHPIGDLYKTQVYALARELKLPRPILSKAPSAGLWKGQTDEDEMGVRYRDLDRILHGFENQLGARAIAERADVPLKTVEKVRGMVLRSEHKRHGLVVPKVGFRTPGLDWRAPPSRGL
ncbi:MAG: NAD+ synthase [Halobacteriales archaeon]|nr:NAD+ synthase [Halobacteriales archaeon]